MKISSQPKGGIYEVNFGYNLNLEGYTTLMLDIPKLSEMFGCLIYTYTCHAPKVRKV
ncbi:MAG: hypothetical protein DIAAKJNI_00495 [Candidatus Argoarchaeum ethanivorans]|uniref:Uncharacterized protein n=1 Tax=Candidatus Argoarchaeum ethanivorans TaxID=2608793 RepID=A0A811T831_9EURY|nr:MAG: hypothetical protein DIAAKJNI_00495 [Candidatus Argoarchaeum ethanivorans]